MGSESGHHVPNRIRDAFSRFKGKDVPGFIPYIMAGYPVKDATVPLLLALEKAGADVIELGMPFSDPIADGPVIQESGVKALANGVNLAWIFDQVSRARREGLQVPVVLMGYYNPILSFGIDEAVDQAKQSGVDAFLIVDLNEKGHDDTFLKAIQSRGLKFVYMISPTTNASRLKHALDMAEEEQSFVYLVSLLGVTGTVTVNRNHVHHLIQTVRKSNPTCNVAVGFGISTKEHVQEIGQFADAVVVGTQIIREADKGSTVAEICESVTTYLNKVLEGREGVRSRPVTADASADSAIAESIKSLKFEPSDLGSATESSGLFGDFGGQFIPEILSTCLRELEEGYLAAKKDPKFWDELNECLTEFAGRETPLHAAERVTAKYGGAKIWYKREDLNHTGAHKINNAIGQVLLAKRLGKRRIIAETGAGQHGVATATACAKYGLECIIFMGAEDCHRQSLNVFRIRLLGATVVPVSSGSSTLKDAINEAMREWVRTVHYTHYIIGSVVGPHPFPTLVRDFQSIIGREAREQFMRKNDGRLPDRVVACVGGGSNAMGIFHPFRQDEDVVLVGVEAAGQGMDTDKHSATILKGTPGVLHGTRTLLLQDEEGQITETTSISAGLDYPGVGPEHAHLFTSKRAEYHGCSDADAIDAFMETSQLEGIVPALETSHALYVAYQMASKMSKAENILVCLSGRGDKDVQTVQGYLDLHPEAMAKKY